MEGNPHSVIEGMMIAARAIGADEGYVYVRTEYPLAVQRVRRRGRATRGTGLAGRQHLRIGAESSHPGHGRGRGFVCGEETAPDGLDRRQARNAPSQAAVSRPRAGCGASRP